MVTPRKVRWLGPIPQKCDTCETPIVDEFYDAKTSIQGKWACMCPSCQVFGPGLDRLGTGWGQRFQKQPDGTFLKVAG